MVLLNPFSGMAGGLSAAANVSTIASAAGTVATAASESSFALQRPRASFASGLAFAVSLSLFGSLPALSGCGRTGLYGPENDAPVADAGTGGDGGTRDAGVSDGGMDAGTVIPAYISDLDCDDVPDLIDNCPLTPNTNQIDSDRDGIGDVCDNDSVNPDSDNDGIVDGVELFQLGTDVTKADTDGDGILDGADACPLSAGPTGSQGCQPAPPTCEIQAVPLPFTLCDGTMVDGFRILWNVGNASTAALKEGTAELTRKHLGQVYVYPPDARTYEISAESPFGNCANAVTVTP
ncbi:MAG TPA: thrombospondin type 3 repeat-containing protein [bacterium]|nr:thrombospondin type 3 repeat-containing protein [bacterium]